MTTDWATIGVAVATVIGGPLGGYLVGRRGRRASVNKDEADAVESLTNSVVSLGQRLDFVSKDLREAHTRLEHSEARAVAAEQRAAAAELRAATSESEVLQLRAEVGHLRLEVARYKGMTDVQTPAG